MGPVLQALGAAHRGGIIHRDVKPENVILREDGDREGRRLRAGPGRHQPDRTTSQTGVLLGTVAYLSPEQVERGIADARSDVYAAGLILFEMLTGHQGVHRRHPDPRRLPARPRLDPGAVVSRVAGAAPSSTRWWPWPPRATPTSGPPTPRTSSPRCASPARC